MQPTSLTFRRLRADHLLLLSARSWRLQRSRPEGSPVSPVESSAPASPCTNGGKSVTVASRVAARQRRLPKTSPQRNTRASFLRRFSCQQVMRRNSGASWVQQCSFCTLNGSSRPRCCEDAIVAVAVESFPAAGRIQCSPPYASLPGRCGPVLSFSAFLLMCVAALLWLQTSTGAGSLGPRLRAQTNSVTGVFASSGSAAPSEVDMAAVGLLGPERIHNRRGGPGP